MKSRVEKAFSLRGTKRTAVSTGNIYSGAGKSDRAPIVIIPLLGEDHLIRNILLVHVDFRKDLNPMEKREVLGDRFNKISNLINECDLLWDDGYLEKLSIEFLLGEGIGVIAERIIKILRGGLDNEDDIDY
jgi:glucosamine--fructose-6-phosphate aminotransferase (isomerizing)